MTGTRTLELCEAVVACVITTPMLVDTRNPMELGSNSAADCPLKSSEGSRSSAVELGEIWSGGELNGGAVVGKLGVVRRMGAGVGAREGEARMRSELDG